ncbi:hypothetical protein JCM10213v2_005109 [Rhodosporidiobolus nylandii]
MSSLHHNPVLQNHAQPASSARPTHSHGGDPSSSSSTSSGGYDGTTLSYVGTGASQAPLTGGSRATEDGIEEDEAGRVDVAFMPGEQVDAAGQDGLLHPPETDERPEMQPRTSSERLRRATLALEAANILTLGSHDEWESRPPGIDPKRFDVPDLKCQCVVQVAEYSAEKAEFSVITNKEGSTGIEAFLDKGRPEFAKVRWIHVNGLSWDVIKPLALHYDLHPLSLEDLLHHSSSSSTRSKVDYFKQHLFVSLIVHRTLDQPGLAANGEMPEEVVGPGIGRTTTKGLKNKGAGGSKDRSGHLREQFGFHHHRRDEEAIVESTTSLPLPSAPSTAETASPSGTNGTATPAEGNGKNPSLGTSPNPRSYTQYLRHLRAAFVGVKRPKEETDRTLSHNRSGLSTRLRGRAPGFGRGKKGAGADKRFRKDEDERAAARWTVAALTKDVKVHIHVEQLGIFLFRDGTILSFTQDAGYHRQISQLFERLQSRDDLLRDSEDASFVLQALLDVTADDGALSLFSFPPLFTASVTKRGADEYRSALGIIDEYREQLTMLESKVLSRADMEDVRHLHILSSQLLLLKSTLTPLQLLLQSLRAHDDAKAAAAFRLDQSSTRPSSPAVGHSGSGSASGGGGTPHSQHPQRKGFVSQEAKIYLGDVMDHVDSVLSSLELFGELSENLIAFVFNAM